MLNSIDEIKRQYIFAIQPVKLFENQNSKATQNTYFDFDWKNFKMSNYNPFHPNISDGKIAKNLDVLG